MLAGLTIGFGILLIAIAFILWAVIPSPSSAGITKSEQRERKERGKKLLIAASVLWGVGGLSVIGGIVMFLQQPKDNNDDYYGRSITQRGRDIIYNNLNR